MVKAGPTPIRRQYLQIKKQYQDAILLFQLGDFYEAFDEDARVIAKELEIVLTSREMGKSNRVPMAGIPYHALENYLAKLISHDHRVAICEQVTKPSDSPGIVDREVVRVVTPGTIVEPDLLDSHANNYLAGVAFSDDEAAIAHVDITTSEFAVTQLPRDRAFAELERLRPSEVIAGTEDSAAEALAEIKVTTVDDYWFESENARQTLLDQFKVATLEGFGCARLPLAITAAGAVVRYLQETQKTSLGQISSLTTYSTENFMTLDARTQDNLDLFRGTSGSAADSLLSVIDLTRTSMGSRLLKRWLGQPLLDVDILTRRHDAVGWFHDNSLPRIQVTGLLGTVADIERLVNRIAVNVATPQELITLRDSLELVPEVRAIIAGQIESESLAWLITGLKSHKDVVALISEAISDEPSNTVGDGNVIRTGFAAELDSLREVIGNARQYLANLEKHEQAASGIKSLRVGYNRVFGYYFEISNANLSQVPEHYIRKQTLVGGERYYTPELKEHESTIINASERISELETDLFRQVCHQVAATGKAVLAVARAIAEIDVLAGLAEVAVRHDYARPELTEGTELTIIEGRHPVVERVLTDSGFVPNDTHLSNDGTQIIILTGPNMAGKSTYLRQVALIVLLTQIGSFVPARSTRIGLVDRIFTRIGARDDLASGESTFMMEMVETANILNNATSRSLLILDEIGRGTSTYDGLSIARAVAEYIHNHPRLGTKTLFATHYHEMVELAGFLPRVRNYNVAVAEDCGEVVFLRKIVSGGVDKSYGIHVAKLAGLPRPVIHRAQEVLDDLESNGRAPSAGSGKRARSMPSPQLPLPGAPSPLIQEIKELEIDSMTPLDALTHLYELQRKARGT